jgi:cyclic pyranopterin phosphate synthase
MPEDAVFHDGPELLSFAEIERIVRVAAELGVNKVRVTGGEPLLRKGVHELIHRITNVPGITDVGLTTNGILLADQANDLYAAGLRRLNVSLDTLDPARFRLLARRGGLERVLAGLETARRIGFAPIKVNAVAIRGFAEFDVVPLARFCRERGLELRFIEYMPIGAEPWERDKFVPAHEILTQIEQDAGPLLPARFATSPSTDYYYPDGGTVGVIASVSQPFCQTCNRLRLTADGKIRNCLFALDEADVKPLLRDTRPTSNVAIANVLRRTVWEKWAGHQIDTPGFVKPVRTMHAIGG